MDHRQSGSNLPPFGTTVFNTVALPWCNGCTDRCSCYTALSCSRTNVAATTWLESRLFVEVRLVATIKKFTARVNRNRSQFDHEPKRATQEARFIPYCRLLPPREIAKSF